MDDTDSSSSDAGEPSIQRPSEDEPRLPPAAVVDDLAGDVGALPNDTASRLSLRLDGGVPLIKPRPYQLEMVEESLKHNIVVAVCVGCVRAGQGEDQADSGEDGYGVGEDAYVSDLCVRGVVWIWCREVGTGQW